MIELRQAMKELNAQLTDENRHLYKFKIERLQDDKACLSLVSIKNGSYFVTHNTPVFIPKEVVIM